MKNVWWTVAYWFAGNGSLVGALHSAVLSALQGLLMAADRTFCGYWPDCKCRRKCRYHTKRFQLWADIKLMLDVLYIKVVRGG